MLASSGGTSSDDNPLLATEPPNPQRGADLLRQIIEHTGEVAYRYRLSPTRGYDYISEAVIELLGYTPDELYSDPALPARIVYPDDRELMRNVLEAPDGQEVEVLLRWVRRDGRVVPRFLVGGSRSAGPVTERTRPIGTPEAFLGEGCRLPFKWSGPTAS